MLPLQLSNMSWRHGERYGSVRFIHRLGGRLGGSSLNTAVAKRKISAAVRNQTPVVQIVTNFSDQALPWIIHCGISSDPLNIHHNSENTCSSVYVRFDYESHQHELRKRKRETLGKRHQWRGTEYFPQSAGCGHQGSCDNWQWWRHNGLSFADESLTAQTPHNYHGVQFCYLTVSGSTQEAWHLDVYYYSDLVS